MLMSYLRKAFSASVWLNDIFLNTSFGKYAVLCLVYVLCNRAQMFYLSSSDNTNSIAQVDQAFTFPEGSVKVGQDNVITIVQVGFVHFFCYKNN